MEQNIQVLLEDSSVLCCVKPAGMLSQSAAREEESLLSLLQKQTGQTLYLIHRLDRPVGGVMVFAKTKEAAADLSAQAADHTLEKRYVALVHGDVQPEAGELRDLLFKDARTNKVFVVSRMRKGVKEAVLRYRVTQRQEDRSRVEILLQTGRTHQIRVQFASRQHPLVGDRRYGAKDEAERLCLWSRSLTFTHPLTKETVTVEAKAPF